jgi:hypothetical protein
MSKITPKNLHYDSTLPPFLARLQANNDTRDGRHEFHAARPKKARNPEDEVEDEPVYFNEETGETLTKKEWEAKEENEGEVGSKGEESEVKDTVADGDKTVAEVKEGKEKLAAIGGGKKRKVGKVVAGDEEGPEPASVKSGATSGGANRVGGNVEKGKVSAKKVKKMKLSFGDDE